MFDAQVPNKSGFDGPRRTSGSNSTFKKASSTANFADDLASIFGGNTSIWLVDFQLDALI